MWNDLRVLNALTVAMLVVAVIGAGATAVAWAVRRPMFELRAIDVEAAPGSTLAHVGGAQVRTLCVPQLRGNFFTLDLAHAKRAFEAVPWVRKATVARAWPDRLVVQLEERVPLGVWGDGRGVDVHGELFAVNSAELEAAGDLPELSGPSGSEATVAQRLRDFAAWFAPLQLVPERVELSSRYAWTVTLADPNADDGDEAQRRTTVIELGRELDANTLQDRALRFVRYARDVSARWGGAIRAADMRYPNGFAVRVAGVTFLPGKDTK